MIRNRTRRRNNNVRNPVMNNNEYIFIDDLTYKNRTIYMIFKEYIDRDVLQYFTHVQNNVFFIKENKKLNKKILNNIKIYPHLLEYYEIQKPN